MSESLKVLVDEWLRLDKNVQSRKEIQTLWNDGHFEELESRMRHRIEFGTAGLRATMGAGWSRMNDLTVIQASQGLCAYSLNTIRGAKDRGIVIGHDHRLNSDRWARLTATVFISFGMKVYLLEGLVHTPMVPFSVKKLNAACGVMITASHNPKNDNGYKVYWENAVQIIGPHDSGIAKAIESNLEPKVESTNSLQFSALCINCTEELIEAYFDMLTAFNLSKQLNQTTHVKFANTSMHGVSDPFIMRGFSLFGLPPYIPVRQQQQPDPDFPTVRFPNPEEKGQILFEDLALSTADNEGASYVLAQDPDSDRFAAAERSSNGEWTNFTGDQLGVLFASRVLAIYKASDKPIAKLAMVASTVSSKMIEAIAAVEGFKFVECLTGFKFIGNTALDLVSQGYEVPFGYEEAIGFMFGSEIRDKDGVAATLAFVELAVNLHAQGKTVMSFLQELYEKYGFFQTNNSYFVCNDPSTTNTIFARLRKYDSSESTRSYPKEIAGLHITRIVDLTTGYDTLNPPSYEPSLPLSSGHMIQFRAESKAKGINIVLTIRTSGTEPKIKYYLEGSGKDATAVSALLPLVVAELGSVWLEAGKNKLERP